jgi:MFS family permease
MDRSMASHPPVTPNAAQSAAPTDGGSSAVVVSAAIMALALLGDSLLYVVLPLYAHEFGIGLAWVGVLLSANRLIRVVAYGGVAALGERIGPRRLTLIAGVLAAVSTLLYAVGDGGPVLLAARIVWGLAFAALNLTTLVYAVSRTGRQGRSVGTSKAVASVGPVLSLSIGAWLVTVIGPRDIFAILAGLTVLAIPLSLMLPAAHPVAGRSDRSILPRPTRNDLLGFIIGFGIDGIFVMTLALILKDVVSMESAVIASGLMIALRRLMEIVTAPIGGVLGDRFGAARMVLLFGGLLCAGLAGIAAGLPFMGACAVVLGHGALVTLQPVLVAQRNPGAVMNRLAVLATWRDIGAAVGPLTAGLLAARFDLEAIYAPLAVATLVMLVWACRPPGPKVVAAG